MMIETIDNGKVFYDGTGTTKNNNPASGRTQWQAACVKLKCHCGAIYIKRVADINRGWGKSCSKSCSKSCAAIKRKYGRPNATFINGDKVSWGKKYVRKKPPIDRRKFEDKFEVIDDFDPSWDAHKDSVGGRA